jgi:phosphate transport system protein
MSPRLHYQKELKDLSNSLRDMSESVREAYEKLLSALEANDWDEIEEIAASEKMFSEMQRVIEAKCLYLTARQQPMAGDLRLITATLKVVADFERIGDQIADIAELFLRIDVKKSIEQDVFPPHFDEMLKTTGKMLGNAIDAFFAGNPTFAETVIRMDDEVDAFFNQIKDELITHLKNNSKDADECIDILMVAKHLEKIGDYAEDIAQWQIFRETGIMKDTRLL